jgi:competence protein ComEC
MRPTVALWDKAPFIRLVIALCLGILLQSLFNFTLQVILFSLSSCFIALAFYSFLNIQQKFRFTIVNGIFVNILIASAGAFIMWMNDIRNNPGWFGHQYKAGDAMIATINEPLVTKANSYKAVGSIQQLNNRNTPSNVNGKIIIYFHKDSFNSALHYGNEIVFKTAVSEIRNSGNPGSFDYRRYCLYQGITHQVYLTSADYKVLPVEQKNPFTAFIYNCRQWVLTTLKTYIPGSKEQGFAEAILIGYKDDLDKNLVQAYSNTGVVHIIAISGLHIGIIYLMLLFLLKPLENRNYFKWLHLLIVLSGLWLFSILAGAQASVLRSALMFSCLAVGRAFSKRSSIYNTLALSAFALLCFDPYWLWDVGFQLSYAAVLSIIIFFKPIYNWFNSQNKLVDFCCKTIAVTIAAQILTLPLTIYYFHQLPLLFLLTNFIAVPLSSLIVITEIILCGISFVPLIANLVAAALLQMIVFLNQYIEGLSNLPFSTWGGISMNLVQTVLLFILFLGIYYWLMDKNKKAIWISLAGLVIFSGIQFWSGIHAKQQHQVVIYNVPKLTAVDLVDGNSYFFIGDQRLVNDPYLVNFHLRPCRIMKHLQNENDSFINLHDFRFAQKHILLLDTTLRLPRTPIKPKIDLAILSKNPKLYISNLVKTFDITQVVIDGSVPAWKARLWQHDCDSLHLPCYYVTEKGAFVMNVD